MFTTNADLDNTLNPSGQLTSTQFMKDEFTHFKQDLYGAFVQRGIELAQSNGLMGLIIGDTWMSIKSFETLRQKLLDGHSFGSFVHMRDVSNHPDVFGANAAFVLSMAGNRGRYAPFVRLTPLGSKRKEQYLRVALAEQTTESGYYLASGEDFAAIPGSPIVYWLSEKMRAVFRNGKALGKIAEPRQGMATADNARFVRQWWEVSSTRAAFECATREDAMASGARWFPYTDGGEFRRWYGNRYAVVNWEKDGKELRAFERSVVRNPGLYFRESMSWSAVGSGVPTFRSVPAGAIFSNAGMSAFAASERLPELTALCNSTTAERLFGAIAPTLNLGVGEIAKLPILRFTQGIAHTVPGLIAESKRDWDERESSWDFSLNPLVALARNWVS